MNLILLVAIVVVALAVLVVALRSFHSIGPSEVGLVSKRVGRKLGEDELIALNGEAGYQADLLMPGLRFKLWPVNMVTRYPWVQVPPDHIGVVWAQVGDSLPTGMKSALYKPEFGNFADIRGFLGNGGQRGVQRPVLPPGTTAPLHPIGFIVATSATTFGEVVSQAAADSIAQVDPNALKVFNIDLGGAKLAKVA